MKRKIIISVVSVLILIIAFGTLVNAEGAGILEDKYDEVDFEGKTVSIDWLEVVASDERIDEAEEKFNVNLEQLGWPNNEERVARVMSGDSTHDIWLAYSTDIMELAAERVLYPMEDILGDEYYQKMIEQDPENEYIYKSTNLEFMDQRFSLTPYDPVANVFWFLLYNREIVEAEGLTDPQELLAEGEWNWENARRMMEQVTRDTDGDGSNDQWGMANWDMWGINEINAWHMAISNGERLARIDDDGRYVYNINSEPVLDGIREFRNWKMDGLIGPNESFDQGAALFQGRHYDTWGNTEVENWGILPFPAGPEA
ncbi:MAG: ABC transporter substrate-binding protein, partial [Halanaerobiaceae bacterium]